MIQTHVLIDALETRTESFDDGAELYTETRNDGEHFYRRVHIVYPGPAHFVYPARGVDESVVPYGPYEWIHYRHGDLPLPELTTGAHRIY